MAEQKRVNVNFSESAYGELVRLAEEQGRTMSEVLRDALALERYVASERRQGSRILIERKGGAVRELVDRTT